MSTEERLSELAARHAELSAQHAEVAEESARVLDHAAEVHDQLDHPLLDPEDLRDHADRERQVADVERRRAGEDRTSG